MLLIGLQNRSIRFSLAYWLKIRFGTMRVVLLSITGCLSLYQDIAAADPPATPQQAAQVLDLSKFELIHPVESNGVLSRQIAGQSYLAQGTVTQIASELKYRLADKGWNLLEGGMATDQYASETLQKSGFTLSLSVVPSGQPNEVRVTLIHHGNVDFKQLPLPSELVSLFESPVLSMRSSPWPVEETAAKISQALIGSGWLPYGATVGSREFKQNGIRLNVSVMAAPAQENRTVVQVSAVQMSADIPVPEGAEAIQYSDSTRSVSFDHGASMPQVFAAVRELLQEYGWKNTTENPVQISFREHLIFRNAGQDMMEVVCHEVDGKTRTRIDFRTAADVEQLDQKAKAEAVRRQEEMARQAIKQSVVIPKPDGAKITESGETKAEFSLPSGKALATVDAWMTGLEKQGWKRTTNVREKVAGDFVLTKDTIELHIDYVDPGFVPAEVSVSVFGKATLKVDESP